MVSYYSAKGAIAPRRSRSASVRRSDPETVPVTPISYYERESRRRNRALRDELRGAEASGLLDLAVQRGHSWDTIGIATALHALAMKVRDQSTSSQEILRDQRWQRLCSLSFARLVEGEARNLANVAWSLANILERDMPFQSHLAELVTWMNWSFPGQRFASVFSKWVYEMLVFHSTIILNNQLVWHSFVL